MIIWLKENFITETKISKYIISKNTPSYSQINVIIKHNDRWIKQDSWIIGDDHFVWIEMSCLRRIWLFNSAGEFRLCRRSIFFCCCCRSGSASENDPVGHYRLPAEIWTAELNTQTRSRCEYLFLHIATLTEQKLKEFCCRRDISRSGFRTEDIFYWAFRVVSLILRNCTNNIFRYIWPLFQWR